MISDTDALKATNNVENPLDLELIYSNNLN